VRVGVSLRTSYLVDDPREGARWIVERARAAWDAGLDSLFMGDHHAVPVPYYQNSPMLGRLLAEWGDRPFGALYLLALWHPVLVAEQVGTLAALAPGRFILPVALGGGAEQFAAMGVPLRERVPRFESGLDTVRRLLAGDAVDGVRVSPVPAEPLEVWIGASAPKAIDRAARLGDGWLANADATPADAREQATEYRERCAAHRRTPTAVAIRRDVHVGADHSDAARAAEPVIERGYRGFHPSALTYGAIETVAERFAEYAGMGFTDVIVRHLADDQREVLASYERLAEVRRLVSDL
jgi:alkanesulfonate monooxygenase SsuD/methylene tetrahydromethanopterin reductase-like flavin-dependent oxidoreductase (luciferase family)